MPPTTPASDEMSRVWLDWMQKNSRVLVLGIVVAVATLLGAYLYVRSAQIKEERAEAAYEQAQRLMMMGQAAEGETALQAVVDRYAGTNSGALAGMRLAEARMQNRQFGPAISVLRTLENAADFDIFGHSIHGLLGAAYSDSGAYPQAAAEYESAAGAARQDLLRREYMLRAAEMHQSGGNKTRATELYRQLAEGPMDELRGKARRRLGAILAEPAQPGTPG